MQGTIHDKEETPTEELDPASTSTDSPDITTTETGTGEATVTLTETSVNLSARSQTLAEQRFTEFAEGLRHASTDSR